MYEPRSWDPMALSQCSVIMLGGMLGVCPGHPIHKRGPQGLVIVESKWTPTQVLGFHGLGFFRSNILWVSDFGSCTVCLSGYCPSAKHGLRLHSSPFPKHGAHDSLPSLRMPSNREQELWHLVRRAQQNWRQWRSRPPLTVSAVDLKPVYRQDQARLANRMIDNPGQMEGMNCGD